MIQNKLNDFTILIIDFLLVIVMFLEKSFEKTIIILIKKKFQHTRAYSNLN